MFRMASGLRPRPLFCIPSRMEELLSDFPPADLTQLALHGIPAAEAERQLMQLRGGQQWLCLERPCTVGDGIRQIPVDLHEVLQERFALAAGDGLVARFVPASGAATRMFQPLQTASGDGGEPRRFLAELDRFPFTPALAATLSRTGHALEAARRRADLATLRAALLEAHGLDYARLPKGLLAFHRAGDEVRTAFVEHLAEAAQLVGAGHPARLHFTVSPEHLPLFERHLAEWRGELERCYGASFEVLFSIQDPATDTLALASDQAPLRDADGRLLLRPGGHGALLTNLAALDAEVVLIRNIDNVVPDARKGDNLLWDRLLGGLLLELVDVQRALLEQLQRTPGDAAVRRWGTLFLRGELGVNLPDHDLTSVELTVLLDRPLRVCGMVKNSGEPGGGPFWVRGRDGALSRQIVESSQVDRDDPEQAATLAAATHFNPVDMACCLRDGSGYRYDLARFIDHAAAIVTTKVQSGQPIRILERPGLWNGAMAGWLTVFVELPASTFNPVKTVFDLLRPAHQP
ncbi:MAG: DUF4301 family protein [Desulfuromonas sp.]|nr:DUF4301 family protein [Desulfuromonas sp.]